MRLRIVSISCAVSPPRDTSIGGGRNFFAFQLPEQSVPEGDDERGGPLDMRHIFCIY